MTTDDETREQIARTVNEHIYGYERFDDVMVDRITYARFHAAVDAVHDQVVAPLVEQRDQALAEVERLARWNETGSQTIERLNAELLEALAKLDLPCGSCHPCTNWADETWRRADRKPPHVHRWDEAQALLRAYRAHRDGEVVFPDEGWEDQVTETVHAANRHKALDELLASWGVATQPAEPASDADDCHACYTCLEPTFPTLGNTSIPYQPYMIVCSTCGNKRCPHATDHHNTCTGSNESGQPGSRYAGPAVNASDLFPAPATQPAEPASEADLLHALPHAGACGPGTCEPATNAAPAAQPEPQGEPRRWVHGADDNPPRINQHEAVTTGVGLRNDRGSVWHYRDGGWTLDTKRTAKKRYDGYDPATRYGFWMLVEKRGPLTEVPGRVSDSKEDDTDG